MNFWFLFCFSLFLWAELPLNFGRDCFQRWWECGTWDSLGQCFVWCTCVYPIPFHCPFCELTFPFLHFPLSASVSLTVVSPWCVATVGSWEGGKGVVPIYPVFWWRSYIFILLGLGMWSLQGFLDSKPLACSWGFSSQNCKNNKS